MPVLQVCYSCSYEHRRQWVVDRVVKLQQVYCIDLCAYAVMSDHYHLVLGIDEDRAAELTIDEVIHRILVVRRQLSCPSGALTQRSDLSESP